MTVFILFMFIMFVVYPLLAAFGALFGACFVNPLWDWIMPELFGLPEITYWQAWGICWLSGLLFKSSSTLDSLNELFDSKS